MSAGRRVWLRATPQTLRRSALSTCADRHVPAAGQVWDSARLQSAQPGRGEPSQGAEFGAENAQARAGDAIRLAAILSRERLNPSLLLQAGDRAIQRSRPQADAAEAGNILDHGVSMLRPTRQAGQHKQRRVGEVAWARVVCLYYVSRTTHDVVVAQGKG